MKLAYIAGPYRGKTINETRENIRLAEKAAVEYWEKGYAVICPHLNSAFLDGICSDEHFLRAYEEILKRCDLVVMLPGWTNSVGSKREFFLAEGLGIPTIMWDERGRYREVL